MATTDQICAGCKHWQRRYSDQDWGKCERFADDYSVGYRDTDLAYIHIEAMGFDYSPNNVEGTLTTHYQFGCILWEVAS